MMPRPSATIPRMRHASADQRQQRAVREHLHAIVDRVLDGFNGAQRMASEMGRGYVSSQPGNSRSHHGGSAVEAVAFDTRLDPCTMAQDWLGHFAEFRSHALNLDNELRRLQPDLPKPDRENTIELCMGCELPAPKVKRLDGRAYHPGKCWWRAYRARNHTGPAS